MPLLAKAPGEQQTRIFRQYLRYLIQFTGISNQQGRKALLPLSSMIVTAENGDIREA